MHGVEQLQQLLLVELQVLNDVHLLEEGGLAALACTQQQDPDQPPQLSIDVSAAQLCHLAWRSESCTVPALCSQSKASKGSKQWLRVCTTQTWPSSGLGLTTLGASRHGHPSAGMALPDNTLPCPPLPQAVSTFTPTAQILSLAWPAEGRRGRRRLTFQIQFWALQGLSQIDNDENILFMVNNLLSHKQNISHLFLQFAKAVLGPLRDKGKTLLYAILLGGKIEAF